MVYNPGMFPPMIRRMSPLAVAIALLAIGCSGGKNKAADPQPDQAKPTDARVAKAAPVDAAALNVRAVPDKWWENPDKHCPPGTKLAGNPPPKAQGAWCWDEKRKRTGPRTGWHTNGTKSSEGWELNNKTVGVWTYWYPDGKKRWVSTSRDDGSQDGAYKRWAPDGTLIGEYVLKNGNGRATLWSDAGKKTSSGMMKNGRRQGLWTSWYSNGVKSGETLYRHGKDHGVATRWDRKGRKIVSGNHAQGRMAGKWTYYDAEKGSVKRVDYYNGDSQWAVSHYQDGKRLGPEPIPGKCSTNAAISGIVAKATGHPLSKRHACVDRPRAFPGYVTVGSFANDRGCMPTGVVVDCVYAKSAPPASKVLARVGWKQANAESRKSMAKRYLRQVATAFRGSLPHDAKHYTFTSAPGGGLTVSVWQRRPSGMRRGWTEDRYEYTFTAAGDMTAKRAETRSGGR